MKQATIKLLQGLLQKTDTHVSEYQESLAVGLKMQQSHGFNGVSTLRDRLAEYQAEAKEIQDCINWVEKL